MTKQEKLVRVAYYTVGAASGVALIATIGKDMKMSNKLILFGVLSAIGILAIVKSKKESTTTTATSSADGDGEFKKGNYEKAWDN